MRQRSHPPGIKLTASHRRKLRGKPEARKLGLGQPIPPFTVDAAAERTANLLATVTAQRDAALKTLTSRANLVGTVEKVDQLVLSLERVVTRLGEGVDLMARLLGLVQQTSNGPFRKGDKFPREKVQRP